MTNKSIESSLTQFRDSQVGSSIIMFGVIAGLTFGLAIVFLYVGMKTIPEEYSWTNAIIVLGWIPSALVLLIIKGDYLFRKIFPDWDDDPEMNEAFRSQA